MTKSHYYHTCSDCGANLDPGERLAREAAIKRTRLKLLWAITLMVALLLLAAAYGTF